jgi:peptidoglycan/xylan/chitin deacetylase (PgdA/CDA1 family)
MIRLTRRCELLCFLAAVTIILLATTVPQVRGSIESSRYVRWLWNPHKGPATRSFAPGVPKAICSEVPILMYHSLAVHPLNTLQIPPDSFAAQMQYLHSAGYNTITFEDLEDWQAGKPIPVKPVLITFDDGYEDNYIFAYPVLQQYGFKATIFLISEHVGTPRHLTWGEIAQMRASGLIEFGAHTETHQDLTTLTSDQQTEEISGSKQAIEGHLGSPVIAFDYPSGRYNDAVVEKTAQAGYEFAVTTDPGYASLDQGLLTLHRVRIDGDEPLSMFARQLP